MSESSIAQRIALHKEYWERRPVAFPPASFRCGDFFIARHFSAARPLLVPGKRITPEMLDVDAFLGDYERMFGELEKVGQSAFWTAEPYTGIPWMEAILGCAVYAGDAAFTAEPWMESLDQIETLRFDPDGPWAKKYLEFTSRLVALSNGRFPVGQPIMRGPTDMIGTVMGQAEMVFALVDQPVAMHRFVERVTDIFLDVIAAQQRLVPLFHGGSAIGFYHLWAPGPSIWFQDDLAAILSPEIYRDFFIPAAERICAGYDYTLVHLHPQSFFVVDDLLKIERLKVIEVNRDVGGLTIQEMMPTLRKILSQKNLVVWGDYSEDDLDYIRSELRVEGLFLNVIARSTTDADRLARHIEQ